MKELVNQLISDLHELSEIDATEQDEHSRQMANSRNAMDDEPTNLLGAVSANRSRVRDEIGEGMIREKRRIRAYLSAHEGLMKLSAERSVFDVAQEIGECLAAWRIATVDHGGMLGGTTPRMTDDPSRIRARAMERMDQRDAWYADRYRRTSSALQQALTLAKTL